MEGLLRGAVPAGDSSLTPCGVLPAAVVFSTIGGSLFEPLAPKVITGRGSCRPPSIHSAIDFTMVGRRLLTVCVTCAKIMLGISAFTVSNSSLTFLSSFFFLSFRASLVRRRPHGHDVAVLTLASPLPCLAPFQKSCQTAPGLR